MITAKQRRARPSTKSKAGKGGNVIDLMAVLKKSLQGGLPQRSRDGRSRRCGCSSAAARVGRRTALTDDICFRAKAYLRAADTLSALVEPLDRAINEKRLRRLPGKARRSPTS
jgi:hypothetical protein